MLSRAHVFVPQNRLNRLIIDAQSVQVRRETTAIGVPAFPHEVPRLEPRLETVKKSTETSCETWFSRNVRQV